MHSKRNSTPRAVPNLRQNAASFNGRVMELQLTTAVVEHRKMVLWTHTAVITTSSAAAVHRTCRLHWESTRHKAQQCSSQDCLQLPALGPHRATWQVGAARTGCEEARRKRRQTCKGAAERWG